MIALIEFVYVNEIVLTQDLALDLVVLAEMYSFSDLQAVCEKYLIDQLNTNNYSIILALSEKLGSSNLKNATTSFILNNLKKIDGQGRSEELSNDYLWQMLLKLNETYTEAKGKSRNQFGGGGSSFRQGNFGSKF